MSAPQVWPRVTGRDASIGLCFLLIVAGFVASWDMGSPGGVMVMVGFAVVVTLALRFAGGWIDQATVDPKPKEPEPTENGARRPAGQ
jgi:cytochrome b